MDLKGPPDIPPSFPLKDKCPSELPSLPRLLMHGVGGGMLLKAWASKKLSRPLESPEVCPGVTPTSAASAGVEMLGYKPNMLGGSRCDVPWGVPMRGTRGAGGAWGWRGLGCSRHGGVQGVFGVQGWGCRAAQGAWGWLDGGGGGAVMGWLGCRVGAGSSGIGNRMGEGVEG